MTDLVNYLVTQAIGWCATAAVVATLVLGLGLSAWLWLAVPLAVAKDLLLLAAMRHAWGPPRAGPSALIGARGHAVEPIDPTGYVRVRGESWRARTTGPEIEKGRPVVVRDLRGLTMVVDDAEGVEN